MAARVPQLPRLSAAALLLAAGAGVGAQTLAGRMGDKALLVVDGRTQVVAPGQSVAGLRVLGWEGEALRVERGGQPMLLRPGAAPSVGPAASAPRAARS